ncbi:ATP-dependent helicase [Fredinandcohnia onubensis]|uniref:ATP-dependent helicase n=1 Tax=Fredinandcohnia onubensis TaxID=1571209 RepID=UPI000C0BDD8F|nr:ATP-dependent helicase [Fredinandcohnia onubensis]
MLPFIQQLNTNQFKAVTAPEGHLLINAAAGTGKTSTLAARILFLQIERNVEASQMLALSFSRSARSGLINKLEQYRQEAGTGSPIETLTFHGLAFRILRIAASLGETWLKPGFKIIDSNLSIFERKSKTFFKDIVHKDSMHILYAKAIDSIRQGHPDLGQAICSPNDLPMGKVIQIEVEHSVKIPVLSNDIKKVWKRYNTFLKRTYQIDYPGLISEAILVLRHPEQQTIKRIKQGLKYLFIDEYQDTSRAQESLAFLLAGENIFINVVGDNEQTIYSFNGSDVSNILDFQERIQEKGISVLEPIHLTENYRSSGNILAVANRIVSLGNSTYKKVLTPAMTVAEEVEGYQLTNNKVRLIHTPRISTAATYIAEEIQKLVLEENIAYSEITILVRKDSEFSPQGTEVKKALEQLNIPVGIKERNQDEKQKLYEATEELCQYHYDDELLNIIASIEQGLLDKEIRDVDSKQIIPILHEAIESGANFGYEALDFLIDASSDEDSIEIEDGVQIRTVHSAKGLEFRVVFVMFLGDKSFPHGSRPNTDEERRLLYVAITRAQDRLYILGRNGIHGPDFFGECKGQGKDVELLDYFARKHDDEQNNSTDDKLVHVVNNVKETQEDEERKQKERLMALFENDDF